MYKVLVVNVIFGIFCIGIVTGCSVKTNKPSNVNKEMTKTKEAVSLDTTNSADKNLIVEENLDNHFDSNMNENYLNQTAQEIKPKKYSNPFFNPNNNYKLKDNSDENFILAEKLEDVFFDFDRHKIDKYAKEILVKNAEWLKQNPSLEVQLVGHCDERGTNNYNIALGERRSFDVKKELIILGISRDKIFAISYGEEKPVCVEGEEICWRKNRRVQFLIKSKA
jgi:peptidoglycan-associated lipoprotein